MTWLESKAQENKVYFSNSEALLNTLLEVRFSPFICLDFIPANTPPTPFFLFAVLGIDPKALYILGKHSTCY
jgi:hypothetical protein